MIYYQKGLGGFFVVFQIAGTSWPYGILPGILSATLGYVLSEIKDLDSIIRDKEEFIDNPYPFQLFAYLVGFVIVFRTNFAYQRYWEGIDAVQRMGAKWLDGACMSIAMDAPGDVTQPFLASSIKPAHQFQISQLAQETESPCESDFIPAGASAAEEHSKEKEHSEALLSHRIFFGEVCHLFSLLHALSMQHLRCDCDLDNLQSSNDDFQPRMSLLGDQPPSSVDLMSGRGSHHSMKIVLDQHSKIEKMHQLLKLSLLGKVAPEERCALETDSAGKPISTLARVTMVEGWIMRRLIARQKFEPAGDMCKTSPPILSRLYQVISDGHLAFSQACKTAETPFPFPYHNLIRVFLWLFVFTVPFVINAKILHVPARFVLNFITVAAYFALAQVGDNLEDPFMPYDPNELPLVRIQHEYNAKLLSMGIVPRRRLESVPAAVDSDRVPD